jgi:hypothetical protein
LSLLEQAAHLASNDLKAHLRERVAAPANRGMGDQACANERSE